MKKKQETEIATNVSSGAEKVEVVEKKKKTAKGDAALGDSVNAEKCKAQDKESKAANERVERALSKKEKKELKKKKRAERIAAYKKYVAEENARIEKRLAEKKAKAQKHAAERKKLAEKRAAEKEEAARKRAHAKADRNRKRAQKKQSKKNNGSNKKERQSYGGWLAAVIALGVTTLALAATVTVGAVEMVDMQSGLTGAQMGTMYELTGLMEHVDNDLDRVRLSVSPNQQGRILTDLLVQTRLAESDLQKLPISLDKDRNVTEFINRTGMECERMLAKLRAGESLSEEDIQTLDRLYKTNHSIREQLDTLVCDMKDKDLREYAKKGKGMFDEAMTKLEDLTLEENRAALQGRMEGAGMRPTPPEGENGKVSVIDAARAEELCRGYFEKYKISEFQCVGETVNHRYAAYNVQGYDENGSMLFAQVDRRTGALVTFDYYEEGNAENFDMDNALKIAQEFLEHLGYEDMEVVRVAQSGSTSDFTFVYEADDVLCYPDTVRVKICRTRGLVCGLDATKYLKNHKPRGEMNAKISMETAREKLNGKVSVETANLALVNTARGERLAYEFLCSYEDNRYLIYLDANTGDEIAIINTQNFR